MPTNQEERSIVVVHFYLWIKEIGTSGITKLLKQYKVLDGHPKDYFVACKENLLQLQETCCTELVVAEDDIELWSVIILLNLINYISSFFCVSMA